MDCSWRLRLLDSKSYCFRQVSSHKVNLNEDQAYTEIVHLCKYYDVNKLGQKKTLFSELASMVNLLC